MPGEIVTFKGRKDALELILDGGADYGKLRGELSRLLQARRSFFNTANMKVFISGKSLTENEKLDLEGLLLYEFGMGGVVFDGDEPTPAQGEGPRLTPDKELPNAAFLCYTVRSGQRIEAAGDIVVLGDVNPGAELVAGGSIAVMGVLRGVAQAGAAGDEKAVVAANQLRPIQLRIAGRIAISPEDGDMPDYPELARIKDGEIVIEPVMGSRSK
jgi:septum site-determining protein MinC